MNRHSILTHARVPYFKKDTALEGDEKRLHGVVLAIKNGGNLVHTPTGQRFSATQFFVDSYKVEGPKERVFLTSGTTAVPIPPSTRLGLFSREQWPCRDIGDRFAERGLVRDARPILTRRAAIVQSHRVRADQRPSVVEVIDSLDVDARLLVGVNAITLIDDVVSTGTNAIGGLVALRKAGFNEDIVLFAAGYTADAGTKGSFFGECVWLEGRKPRAFRPTPNPGWFETVAASRF